MGIARAPRACGALGAFDERRLLKIAELLGDGAALAEAHRDERSAVLLDRPAIAWQGRHADGLGWIEGENWQPAPSPADWRAAARRGACGLAREGSRRFLHTADNGLAPIYWIADEDALYFASRIDPLVRAWPRPLSIDWDAWAAIVALRYPVGERTPFAEVRRLGAATTLRWGRGRAQPERHRWSWAEIEPAATVEEAAEAAVEALRGSIPARALCPLSGGRDSRMLFCALAAEGRAELALTVNDDEGGTLEEDLAEPVAAAFGVSQERLLGRPEAYPAEWEERARRVEYQFVDHAWLVPLARRLAASELPAMDGFAIDIFGQSERHFNPPEVISGEDGELINRALFDVLRRYGHAHSALDPAFHAPLQERAADRFMAATRRFEGHPSQGILSVYATRSLRGVSTYPTCLLGDTAAISVPGATTGMAAAMLSASLDSKQDGRLYSAIFERLTPATAELPSTAGATREPPSLPRRWRSEPALSLYRELLADGPLAEHLSAPLREWLDDPRPELSGHLRLGMESVALLHAWWRRYRDCLRDPDARDLLDGRYLPKRRRMRVSALSGLERRQLSVSS